MYWTCLWIHCRNCATREYDVPTRVLVLPVSAVWAFSQGGILTFTTKQPKSHSHQRLMAEPFRTKDSMMEEEEENVYLTIHDKVQDIAHFSRNLNITGPRELQFPRNTVHVTLKRNSEPVLVIASAHMWVPAVPGPVLEPRDTAVSTLGLAWPPGVHSWGSSTCRQTCCQCLLSKLTCHKTRSLNSLNHRSWQKNVAWYLWILRKEFPFGWICKLKPLNKHSF